MGKDPSYRSLGDLLRAGRVLAEHFETNTVVVIGSQAILAHMPDPPLRLAMSGEIDAYPDNARDWERRTGFEASEEVNALFGYQSLFHQTHGYYIDGVDDATAMLPQGWRDRQKVLPATRYDGSTFHIVTPAIEDLAVSKLARLTDHDRQWIVELKRAHAVDWAVVGERLTDLPADRTERARRFLASIEDVRRYEPFRHDPARPGITRQRLKVMGDDELQFHRREAEKLLDRDRVMVARGRLNLSVLDAEAGRRGLVLEAANPPREKGRER